MKIATVLSVSALLAMFSAVACSSPTTPAGGDDDKSDSASTDGDDDKPTKDPKASSPSNTSTTGTTDNDTTDNDTDTDADDAACLTCLSAEPKYKAGDECAAKCSEDDEACVDTCFKNAGCNFDDDNDVCVKIEDTCADKCEGPPPTDAELQACDSCLSSKNNAQVNAIEKCYADAEKGDDEAAFDKCGTLEDSKCDDSCEAAYDACDSKCGG